MTDSQLYVCRRCQSLPSLSWKREVCLHHFDILVVGRAVPIADRAQELLRGRGPVMTEFAPCLDEARKFSS